MLEIKNNVIVVFHIFLNHNGLYGQVISSSQLWQVDSSSGQLTVFTIYGPQMKEYMIKSSKHQGKKKEMDHLANSKNLTKRNQYCARIFMYA